MAPRLRMVDLAARHRRVAGRAEALALEVLRSGRYIGGPYVDEAERALAARLGMSRAVGVASGTDALLLALQAMGVGPGARVAVPALSFFATAEAVLELGAEPVFVDTAPGSPHPDADAWPADVDLHLLVHLFGGLAPTPTRARPLVSDASQCAGWGHGRPPGELATLSLYPTKTLGASGDGGAVLGDDPRRLDAVRRLGNHGLGPLHVHEGPGRNSRLDALQAALVLAHLDDLDRRVARRRALAGRYDAALASGPARPIPRASGDAVHHYVLLTPARDALREALDRAGIDSVVYYPLPMDAQPRLTRQAQPRPEHSRCPEAARFCARALAIPCHAELDEADVQRVVAALEAWR